MSVRSDPCKWNCFFFIADCVDIFKSAYHLIIIFRVCLADKRYHFACFTVKSSLNTKLSCSYGFLLVCGRNQRCRAALTDIQFNGTGFDTETAAYQIFEIFTAACKHFVTESIGSYGTVIFTDKSTICVMDSLGYTYDQITVLFE